MNQPPEIEAPKLTTRVKAAGCAAKLSALELSTLIAGLPILANPQVLTGIDGFEDAAVYKVNDQVAIIHSVDFFPPVVDDPYIFGQIAATNALSDVYAMGGHPILALNVFSFPTCDYPLEVAKEILRGGAEVVMAAGATLAGGHSIQGPEPLFGLAVIGIVHPQKILTNGGAIHLDAIVLCKAIGTGIGLLGMKGNVLSKDAQKSLISSLTQLNDKSLKVALNHPVHAATDVTGFGLIGHLREMALASQLSARLFSQRVPLLPQSRELAEQGLVPAAAYANRKSYEAYVQGADMVEQALCDLFYDPQTSGGLLLAIEKTAASQLIKELHANGLTGCLIGEFHEGSPGQVEVQP